MMTDISIWVEVFLTLAILSFLYKDNPFYKFSEHLFVGTAVGYIIVIQFRQTIYPNLIDPVMNAVTGAGVVEWRVLLLAIPLVLGVLMFFQATRKSSWLARLPMAVVIGSFSGLAVIGVAQGDLTEQIYANMILPIVRPGAWESFQGDPGLFTALDLISNPVLIFGLITVLVYFYFSSRHKGVVGGVAKTGIYFLMISFGASYGYTVFTRLSLFYDRAILLVDNGWTSLVAGFLIISCLGILFFLNRRRTAHDLENASTRG